MRPRHSLSDPARVDEVRARLARVAPDTPRQWGTMTAHEMLCHLADSFEGVMGERPVSNAETWFMRTIGKWVAINTSLPWPKGVPTRPEVDPRASGTRPADFAHDQQRLLTLLDRFLATDTSGMRHPVFGPMSHTEWLYWGYAHMDHHLRQFGA